MSSRLTPVPTRRIRCAGEGPRNEPNRLTDIPPELCADSLRTARPPIFFKQEDSFRRQLGLWTEARLRPQLDRIAKAELNMKTTGLPAEAVCREAMLAVAQSARERRR